MCKQFYPSSSGRKFLLFYCFCTGNSEKPNHCFQSKRAQQESVTKLEVCEELIGTDKNRINTEISHQSLLGIVLQLGRALRCSQSASLSQCWTLLKNLLMRTLASPLTEKRKRLDYQWWAKLTKIVASLTTNTLTKNIALLML